MDYGKESLKMHYDLKGKIEVKARAAVDSKEALSLAYTPGVATPCLEIQKDVSKSYDLTRRWNTVAVITDGTAVLGLGDIGPEAGMPVMEGKCVLFKEFGDVDAIPLCVRSKDVDEIVKAVSLFAGSFGGINLEDISAPRCFEIERKLKEKCDIPIFHDDQHGTAIITLAGLRAFCGQSPAYKKYTSGILMRIPGINSIIRQYQVSRFCRIMFLLISSDVPLLDALRLTEGVVSFYPYRISVGSICLHIESGGVFSDGIGRYEYLYGKRLTALMKVGEETGTIDRMLYSFGEETEKSLQYLIRQLNNILEHVLILGIGSIVAFVLIAMYMPMFRLGLTIQ